MIAAIVVAPTADRHSVERCLTAVLGQTLIPGHVAVVTHSADQRTVSVCESLRLEAKGAGSRLIVLTQEVRPEFAKYASAGLEWAWRTNAEYAALLDQNVVLESRWCEAAMALMASDASIGAVGSKIMAPNGLTVLHAGGYLDRPRMVARHFGHANGDGRELFASRREVEFVVARAMAMRRTSSNAANPITADQYMDVELCERFREAGLKIVYSPQATATWFEPGSFRDRLDRVAEGHRNRVFYALRWMLDLSFRSAFYDAEVAHLRSILPHGERRGLADAYLWLLLRMPDVLDARVGFNASSHQADAVIRLLADLRNQLIANDTRNRSVAISD